MKKGFFRYALLFFAVYLVICLSLGLFVKGYLDRWSLAEEERLLEKSAAVLQNEITTMMELTGQDFQYLLENKSELIYAALEAQRQSGEMGLFLTDRGGKILLATHGAPMGSLTDKALSAATENAREGISYRTDLDGFYKTERLCRTVVLEKEHSDTLRQRVGLIVLSLPNDVDGTVSKTVPTVLMGGLLILGVFLGLGILLVELRFLAPLRRLDKAAEAYAKGDFRHRLSEKGSGSLTPLFRTFNQMADTVEKNEAVRQTFVSNVSHDLRTPLTTISGFVQNMLCGAIPPEKLPHYYKIILDEVNRLSRLVQTLLETSRMTAGERKYNMAPMDLCELARVTLLSFEKRLEEKEVEVIFFSSQDSLWVEADSDAIQQVVYNLMDNAIKFTPDKGKISVEITTGEKKAFFALTNSGEGIPEEELQHLFDRFYKSDRSRGLDKKGMGLGLFIAKSVIDAHKEEIWVESKRGSYTQFVFSLPLTRQVKKRNAALPQE